MTKGLGAFTQLVLQAYDLFPPHEYDNDHIEIKNDLIDILAQQDIDLLDDAGVVMDRWRNDVGHNIP